VQWAAAKAELQPKLAALTSAREAAVVAENAQDAAAAAARQVTRELEPVSVLISRKSQRLYVRQALEPIFESPVTILDADRPIGTQVFSAMERTSGDTNIRWSVVSLDGGRPHGGVVQPPDRARGGHGRDVEPMLTDPDSEERARPDRHSAGSIGSYRWHGAAIFPDHHGRGLELADRLRHGFRGPLEQRAARRHQDPTTRSADRIPLRAPRRWCRLKGYPQRHTRGRSFSKSGYCGSLFSDGRNRVRTRYSSPRDQDSSVLPRMSTLIATKGALVATTRT
jgi:hypothetical protein